MSDVRVFRARHVAPMSSPLIDDGCVVVEGDRIVDVGRTSRLKPSKIDEEIDGVLMPGLINAHTHLELTNVPRPETPGTFQDWLLTTMASMRREVPAAFARDRADAVQQGIAQCLKFGVTCVGDISQNVEIVRPILRVGPIRSVSFGECLGLGERRARFEDLLKKAVADGDSELMVAGISPHAPYTVDGRGYSEVAAYVPQGFPVTTHVAETRDEAPFVEDRRGPFMDLYSKLGFDPGPPSFGGAGPIDGLSRYLIQRWLLAHVNYCSDFELELLAEHKPSIVWCPRTHRYFGHPLHRWLEMRARGLTVCVGTDSCASSPDLNLVDDLRLLVGDYPDTTPDVAWSLVTTEADAALRWGYSDIDTISARPLGRIGVGAMADFVAFPTRSGDPLREVLETASVLPSGVWVGGHQHGFPGHARG